jgi:hypothetical protein
MDKANSIKFQLLYHVNFGERVFLVLENCFEHPFPIPLEITVERHDDSWSGIVYMADQFISNGED